MGAWQDLELTSETEGALWIGGMKSCRGHESFLKEFELSDQDVSNSSTILMPTMRTAQTTRFFCLGLGLGSGLPPRSLLSLTLSQHGLEVG